MRRIAIGLLCLVGLAAPGAIAQNYPERPIRLVVPYPPGGQFDYHARVLGERMGSLLGQPVVVENRPGANTMLGAVHVKNSANDGYTLLWAGANMLAILPHLHSNMQYKVSDFQSVSLLSELPMGLIIDSKQMPGVNDLQGFKEYVRARPGKIDYASIGVGGAQHLLAELTKTELGIQLNQIIYKGTNEVIAALMAGELPVAFDGVNTWVKHVAPGQRLKMLAVTSAKRLAVLPHVPTFAEAGYPKLGVVTFGAIMVPAGTSRAVVNRLNEAIVKASTDPKVTELVLRSGVTPRTSTPEELDAMIKSDSETWGSVIRSLNIKLD
jgi:tripartite-type tricarboxylate transporter receptor subunit TctC